MRGKRRRPRWWHGPRGLIPAYAGKTADGTGITSDLRAHPRVCGENEHEKCVCGLEGGSSPRMRGKQQVVHSVAYLVGLIPAYAGKTPTRKTIGSQ